MGILRLVAWIVIIYIIARIVVAVLGVLRGSVSLGPGERGGVGRKRRADEFKDVEDADYEDITDKH